MILQIVLYFCFEFDVKLLSDHVPYLVCAQFRICVSVVGANMDIVWIFFIHLLLFILIVIHAYLGIKIVQELVLVGAARHEGGIALCAVQVLDVAKTSVK